MKLLQNMLRREIELNPEHRDRLRAAEADEPVAKLVEIIEAYAQKLTYHADSSIRVIGQALVDQVRKVKKVYSDSWAKKTYEELLRALREVKYVAVKQTGSFFDFYGVDNQTNRIRLRREDVVLNDEPYSTDREDELWDAVANILTGIREGPWVQNVFDNIAQVVTDLKWTRIDSLPQGAFRFKNPKGQVCLIQMATSKLYINFEGTVEHYSNKDSAVKAINEILSKMEPWAHRYYNICLSVVKFAGVPIVEGDERFEFNECALEIHGDQIAITTKNSVPMLYSDEKLLAKRLKDLVTVPNVLSPILKKCISGMPEFELTDIENGFTFRIKEDVATVLFEGREIVLQHCGKTSRFNNTKDGIVEIARCAQGMLKKSWHKLAFDDIKEAMLALPLWPNMQRSQTQDSVTIELKNRRHGFRVELIEDGVRIVHDGEVKVHKNEQTLADHIAMAMDEMMKHGEMG